MKIEAQLSLSFLQLGFRYHKYYWPTEVQWLSMVVIRDMKTGGFWLLFKLKGVVHRAISVCFVYTWQKKQAL
jgi:hypothetical protein